MIIVQVTSIFGAYVSGIYGEKAGFKKALMISLIMMLGTIIWMLFNKTMIGYFIITALAGFALTGVQAVSRTMTGFFAPKGQSAEFYSFESVAGRASSFVGPAIYGWLATGVAIWLERNRAMEKLLAEQTGQRAGLISIAVFLIVGLIILTTVNEKRGRQAAAEYVQQGEESSHGG